MSTIGKLLISEVKLKNYTNINKNVDMDVLKAEIQIAQDIDLQTILGTLFYKHLLAGIQQDGTTTWNVDEVTLVTEYIQPFLIQTAYFNAMPQLMYRTMNRGIVEGQMENAKPVDIETMKYLRSVQKQRADFYLQRLMDFLLTGRGQNKYPQYNTASTIDGMIPDRIQKYNNGIFLNGSSRKGFNLNDIRRQGIAVYSEWDHAYRNCPECY
ncbi:hypothetical protein UFOVP185_30 [uncultured Caudovirales phage]|uniref:Uncharacterized protein n=1 Tax=uncultured Caudovirales phage TaxID=2100421 RepID=A0A6J7WFU4_9CAUD|nr:hypothetical protein UFOVP185_30 [uncultured Caudovirales phage]